MQNKAFKLIMWFLGGAILAVTGEYGVRGILTRYPSVVNTLIIGFTGGFLGFVLGLMANKAKDQNVGQAENQPDLKRATKSFLGIFLRGRLVIFPLMLAALLALFLRPFNGWINEGVAILCLVIVFCYYIFFQMRKVSTFYQKEIGGPYCYKFAGKDFALMIVLILVGLGLIIGAVFFFDWLDNKKSNPSQLNNEQVSQQQETNETTDWQTYRNDEYGYTIEYPEGWEMKTEKYARGFNLILEHEDRRHGQIGFYEGLIWPRYSIRVSFEGTAQISFEEIEDRYCDWAASYEQVSGVKAVRCKQAAAPGGQLSVILMKDNTTWQFIYGYLSSQELEEYYLPTFNQMLSTFKFID